ncbi:hypothetical protein GSI_08120 [Ganoderma sinense ZZ0214-1]|uniref:Uncharacterized protein n=1 Tax=Ganoderma sinense ZZ0214-1 TaxID=1077348 RepID=A0A2G8S7B9_9APHY|nr:hypothetical protein GSI_08120 [Ganoderma sinense ZZ0214-1]
MSRLPSLDEAAQYLPEGDQNSRSLYGTLVLPAEKAAMVACKNVDVMYSCVIGHLLLRPPSDKARSEVARELASCNRESDPFPAVYALGAIYLKHFILIFKKTRGKTPAPSYHPSRPSFNRMKDDYLLNLRATPRDHSSAKAAGLVRDDYRCMLNHRIDIKYGTLQPNQPFSATTTQCCHIFPDSLGNIAVGGRGAKEHQVATVWTILDRFGYKDICNELNADTEGANLHRMENIMTLDTVVHDQFDELRLWLDEIPGEPNCYYVRLAEPLTHVNLGLPDRVQFVAHSDHPLPSAKYLRIHAACCRIAHLAGAAEYIDEILDEGEEIKVLDPDGSSARVLEYYLLRSGSALVPPV